MGSYFVTAALNESTYRSGSDLSEDEANRLQFMLSTQYPRADFTVTYGMPKKVEDGNFEAFLNQY